jgi:hypothetical protein
LNTRWNVTIILRNRIIVSLLALCFFVAITVIFTWPMVKYIDTAVAGGVGDNFYFLWELGWFEKSLIELGSSPYFSPMVNYPTGWYLASTEIPIANSLIALPFTFLSGPALGYNVVVLLSFSLAGYFMFLWVWDLTDDVFSGLIAGSIFTFTPIHFSHYFAGHLHVISIQWLPIYFWGLLTILSSSKRNWLSVVTTGLMMGLISFTSMHFLYMTFLLSFVFLLMYQLFVDKSLWKQVDKWVSLTASALISIPFILVAARPFVDLWQISQLPVRSIESAKVYSAGLIDFILPATFHPLYGQWVGNNFDRSYWIESTLYVGIFTIILVIVAFLFKSNDRKDSMVRMLFWTGVGAFVLALGITLKGSTEPIVVNIPEALRPLLSREIAQIPLPGYFLFKYAPFYSSMRSWMRYGIYVVLFAAAVAGFGVDRIRKRVPPKYAITVGLLMLLLVLFDFWPKPQALTEVKGREVDYWLASQEVGSVAQLPISVADEQDKIFFTLINNKPYFVAPWSSNQLNSIRSHMESFPDKESIKILRDLDVRYILVDSHFYNDYSSIDEILDKLGLENVGEFSGQYVYIFPE